MRLFKIFISYLSLFLAVSAFATVSPNCATTASLYLKRGTLTGLVSERTWDFQNIARTLRARIDPNNCMREILTTAVGEATEYWQGVYAEYNCRAPSSEHYNIPPCRGSDNFTDAESNLLYLSSIQTLYETQAASESLALCGENLEVMRASLLEQLEGVHAFVASEFGALDLDLAPSDRFNGDPCLASLTCMERLQYSAIAAELAQLEASGSLTESSARSLIEGQLAPLGPAARTKIMKALVSHSMRQSAPPQELETLLYLRQGSAFLAPELQEFRDAAQAFQELNDQMQEGANTGRIWERAWYQVSTTYELVTSNVEELELYRRAIDVRRAAEAVTQKLETFSLTQAAVPENTKSTIRDYFQTEINNVRQQLTAELAVTHQSIDQTRKVVMIGASGVFVAGLSVAAIAASPIILPALTASGGTGLITSVLAGTGVVATGANLALGGAAITASTSLVSRAANLVFQDPSNRNSVYCQALEQEMQEGGMTLISNTGTGAVMSAAFGGGIGAMIARGGNWAKAGGVIAAGALGYGGRQLYTSHTARHDALERLRPYLSSDSDRACLDSAMTMANGQTAFDVGVFALDLVGPIGLHVVSGKIRPAPQDVAAPSSTVRRPAGAVVSQYRARLMQEVQASFSKARKTEHPTRALERAREIMPESQKSALDAAWTAMDDVPRMQRYLQSLYDEATTFLYNSGDQQAITEFEASGIIPENIFESFILQRLQGRGFSGDVVVTRGIVDGADFQTFLQQGRIIRDETFRARLGDATDHGIHIHMIQLDYLGEVFRDVPGANILDFYRSLGRSDQTVDNVWDQLFDGGKLTSMKSPEFLGPIFQQVFGQRPNGGLLYGNRNLDLTDMSIARSNARFSPRPEGDTSSPQISAWPNLREMVNDQRLYRGMVRLGEFLDKVLSGEQAIDNIMVAKELALSGVKLESFNSTSGELVIHFDRGSPVGLPSGSSTPSNVMEIRIAPNTARNSLEITSAVPVSVID